MKSVFFPCTLLTAALTFALAAQAENQQKASVQGIASNTAIGFGSTATMNIASNKGVPVGGGNRQIANINGAVINSAVGGGHAELNIASKTSAGSSGSQTMSVGGSIVNQASGGQTSIMNIGSR